METINELIEEILKTGGFEPTYEIHAENILANKDTYYAIPSVKKCEVNKLTDTCGTYLGAEHVFTISVRCIGKDCRYMDAEVLDSKIRHMMRYILRDLDCTVRGVMRGEIERCHMTKRLERLVCFTLVGYEKY